MSTRLEALLKFLQEDPAESFTRYVIGLEYIKLGNTSEGERYLLDTIASDASYIPAYHQLGQLYVRLGRNDDAVDIYTKGIEFAALHGDRHAKSEMEQELQELQDEM